MNDLSPAAQMTDQHPITPPPELVHQWAEARLGKITAATESQLYIATQAARWGADQELEACVKWLKEQRWEALAIHLRAGRRPKLPSLKEQAFDALEHILRHSSSELGAETIRRALEQLDD